MMGLELATNALSASATETLSQTVDGILEFIVAAKDVLVNKESFEQLTKYMERLVPVLKELRNRNLDGSESLSKAVDILSKEVQSAKQLMTDCSKKSRVFLLLRCRAIVSQVEQISREISRALSLVPLADLGLSSGIADEAQSLCESMGRVEFRVAVSEEKIMEKIESGIQERNVERSYANNLMILIAEAVGACTEKSELRKEIEKFKSEIENARLKKNLAEAIQMDQIIALLERSDMGSSPMERESRYFSKRNSLGNQPVEPLQSFICPITRDVMVDPVETSSGQTFERAAIQEWIRDGNTLCPLTMMPIEPSVLRPNKTLRQSIEEWRDRNIMIAIKTTRQKLLFEEGEEVINRLGELRELCEQRDQHREWMILEEYIQLLVELLAGKNPEIRRRVLAVLCLLATDSDDAKERLLRIENGIENIVKSLGRKVEERKLAVALLLEVSKCESARDRIGLAKGCILFLVTMKNSNDDDERATADAQALLANLSHSEDNVVLMAKANYFKHLLELLSLGSGNAKLNVVARLAEMELTDHNKEAVVEGGALGPLLDLVSTGDVEARRAALSALRNLSTVPNNGLWMIRRGAERPLLDILFHGNIEHLSLNKIVATTVMNLALASAASRDSNNTSVAFLESDEDVGKLFGLVSSKGPDVQQSILQTFHILSQSSSKLKAKLIQYSGFPVLIQLCENKNLSVRANSVKLFCCLTEGSDETIVAEHVSQKFVETVVDIARSSSNDEETISALGIISNLPETPQITAWLIEASALPAVSAFLAGNHRRLNENAAGAISRLAAVVSPEELDGNTVPTLVRLLETGTTSTKQHSAAALGRLSSRSRGLSRPIPKRAGLFMCFSGAAAELGCPVHSGVCCVGSTFCLVEAGAVEPLVRVLGEAETASAAAAMDALSSLIEGELLQCGSKVLDGANAVQPMIKLLGSASPLLQEKALGALQRMFQLVELRHKYGMRAQMSLVDLTQSGNGHVKSMAATILAQLNVIPDQSSFFGS